MNTEQQQAYGWAKSHDYPSVAAQYARALASAVDDLQAQLTESQRRERAAVEDMEFGLCCVTCAYSRIKGLRGVCALGGKESCNDGVHGYKKWQWRGQQEAPNE